MIENAVRHKKNNRSERFWNDTRLAIGFILGAIITVYIVLVIVGLFAGISSESVFEMVPVTVSLLVSTVSIYIASKALLEQRKAREAATDPVLIPHFGLREDARELITFNVTNVGAGAALNVRIAPKRPANSDDWRLVANIFEIDQPISTILQNGTREYGFAMGHEVVGKKPFPPFDVKLEYSDINGAEYEGLFALDVREFSKIGVHKSPQMRIVAALESIDKKFTKK